MKQMHMHTHAVTCISMHAIYLWIVYEHVCHLLACHLLMNCLWACMPSIYEVSVAMNCLWNYGFSHQVCVTMNCLWNYEFYHEIQHTNEFFHGVNTNDFSHEVTCRSHACIRTHAIYLWVHLLMNGLWTYTHRFRYKIGTPTKLTVSPKLSTHWWNYSFLRSMRLWILLL
jgi:hypothetical protein